MKKSKSLLLSVLMAGATLLPLSSCGNNDKVIRLQLTASKPGDVLTQSATALEPYLEAEMPGYDFKITVGTDFAADGTGLAAGTIDAAFMTASTFATTEIAEPGKVEMILRSTRAGFKVIEDFADKDGNHTSAEARELQLAAMNGKDGYKYRGEASKDPVSYYYAECIIKKDKVAEFDLNKDGVITLDELAGKKICMQAATSPAGYSYPRYAFSQVKEGPNGEKWENGMTMVTSGTPDASKGEYLYVKGSGYSTDFNNLMDGQYDALWGYMDVRLDAFNGGSGWEKWKGDEGVFQDKTYTVALTQGILNDGVAVRSSLDAEVKKGIADAFKKLVKEGDMKDDGKDNDVDGDGKASPAYIINSLYTHTGYVDTKNSDYEEEIEFQKWSAQNLK